MVQGQVVKVLEKQEELVYLDQLYNYFFSGL